MKKLSLTEATILALEGKLTEVKLLVNRADWVIHNDHEASWFGGDACWKDMRELNLKSLSDDEKIKALQSLKDNIDKDVVQRDDYQDIDSKYISAWLDGYKSNIDWLLNEIDSKGKYYIFLNVDVSNRGDVDHRGSGLIIDNGSIKKGTKYYDTKDEAQKDMNSISQSQYKRFVFDNFIGEYDEDFQWEVSVKEFESNVYELN